MTIRFRFSDEHSDRITFESIQIVFFFKIKEKIENESSTSPKPFREFNSYKKVFETGPTVEESSERQSPSSQNL